MSSPEMKRTKKKNPTLQPISILSLPDELLLSCVARISRLCYRTLSLVCKRFESIVASQELYKVRSLSGLTESCLYVCVSYNRKPRIRWLTLYQKPNGGYIWVTVPIPDFPPAQFLSLVALGSNIYNIAGSVKGKIDVRSSSVSILDCKSHTWREGPSFPEELFTRTVSVVDENVCVLGVYEGGDLNDGVDTCLEDTFHVLDTETQVWIPKEIPESVEGITSACIDGKFHVKDTVEVNSYNWEEDTWEVAGKKMGDNMELECYCDIGNVLYSAFNAAFTWYDSKIGEWRELKGLVGLPKFLLTPTACDCVKLADHGGKMAVFWVEDVRARGGPRKMISCVVIALERRECGEMWGTVEWVDQVLAIPKSCHVVKALAVTL